MISLKNQVRATFVTAVMGLCLVTGCNNQDERETGRIGGTGAVRGGAGTGGSSPSISETGPGGRTLPSPKAGESANGRGGSSSIIGTGQGDTGGSNPATRPATGTGVSPGTGTAEGTGTSASERNGSEPGSTSKAVGSKSAGGSDKSSGSTSNSTESKSSGTSGSGNHPSGSGTGTGGSGGTTSAGTGNSNPPR